MNNFIKYLFVGGLFQKGVTIFVWKLNKGKAYRAISLKFSTMVFYPYKLYFR